MLIAFNKPFGVHSRFTAEVPSHRTLAEFELPPRVYPLGRLDHDSEGLLLLSDEKGLNTALLHPDQGHTRTYWAQVEGDPDAKALQTIRDGPVLQGRKTSPCEAWLLQPQPAIPDRIPPIRSRKHIPTAWIALCLSEGKNRQVRRMTAAAGLPTLRLIRVSIGSFELGTLAPGCWRVLERTESALLFKAQQGRGREREF